MTATELLLLYKPEDAIVRMFNDANGTSFPFGTFDIGVPTALAGRDTQVSLAARRRRSSNEDFPYSGSVDFVYRRLDLTDRFSNVLDNFRPPIPTSTQVILNELSSRVGSEFVLDDVVLEEIVKGNSTSYLLKAKGESLRWIGAIEITLAEYEAISQFILDALPPVGDLGLIDSSPQLASISIGQPYINATPFLREIDTLLLGEVAQDYPRLLSFINEAIPPPGMRIDQQARPWIVSATAAPYNLFNAKIVSKDIPVPMVDRILPELDLSVVVELDLAYCSNFTDKVVVIPYTRSTTSLNLISDQPRLARHGVLSDNDATAYSAQLVLLTAGTVITPFNVMGPLTIEDTVPWVVDSVTPSQTNLYNSVVVYNGVRRPWDPLPANPLLTKILIIFLGEFNTAYRGNMAIYYN